MQWILKCEASNQIKYSVILAIQWSILYFAKASTPCEALTKCLEQVEMCIFDAVCMIEGFSAEERSRYQAWSTGPIEGGGGGLIPWSAMQKQMREMLKREAADLVRDFSFQVQVQAASPISVKAAWHQIWHSMRPQDEQRLSDEPSWLSAVPATPGLNLDDETFNCMLRWCMGLGQQFTYTCPTSKLNFEQTSQAKIHQHLTSCSVCSGPIRFLRHERIVAAVHRVLRWQGFVSESNPFFFFFFFFRP